MTSELFSEKSKFNLRFKEKVNNNNYRMTNKKNNSLISKPHSIMEGEQKFFVPNPISGRNVRVGGITYKGLVREGKLQRHETDKKIYNSTTNRFINIRGVAYKKAVKRGEVERIIKSGEIFNESTKRVVKKGGRIYHNLLRTGKIHKEGYVQNEITKRQIMINGPTYKKYSKQGYKTIDNKLVDYKKVLDNVYNIHKLIAKQTNNYLHKASLYLKDEKIPTTVSSFKNIASEYKITLDKPVHSIAEVKELAKKEIKSILSKELN